MMGSWGSNDYPFNMGKILFQHQTWWCLMVIFFASNMVIYFLGNGWFIMGEIWWNGYCRYQTNGWQWEFQERKVVIYMWDNPRTKGNFLDCHGWHRSVYNLCTLWWTYKKLLKMAIEIVDFPIKNGGSFHCYVSSPEGNLCKAGRIPMVGGSYSSWRIQDPYPVLAVGWSIPMPYFRRWSIPMFHKIYDI